MKCKAPRAAEEFSPARQCWVEKKQINPTSPRGAENNRPSHVDGRSPHHRTAGKSKSTQTSGPTGGTACTVAESESNASAGNSIRIVAPVNWHPPSLHNYCGSPVNRAGLITLSFTITCTSMSVQKSEDRKANPVGARERSLIGC